MATAGGRCEHSRCGLCRVVWGRKNGGVGRRWRSKRSSGGAWQAARCCACVDVAWSAEGWAWTLTSSGARVAVLRAVTSELCAANSLANCPPSCVACGCPTFSAAKCPQPPGDGCERSNSDDNDTGLVRDDSASSLCDDNNNDLEGSSFDPERGLVALNLSVQDVGSVLLDSGASDCMTGNRDLLVGPLHAVHMTVKSADAASALATVGHAAACVPVEGGVLRIPRMFLVPGMDFTLILRCRRQGIRSRFRLVSIMLTLRVAVLQCVFSR